MTIERIVDYVMHTPHNTNRAVLIQMLKDLIQSQGSDVPGGPGSGGEGGGETQEIIYDGGTEN